MPFLCGMKFSCLLVDDDPIALDGLEVFARKLDTLHIEALCSNAVEAIAILQQKHIDIVFSDIEMPDISGTELIRSLKNPPVFVLISSHPEYALEGFELNVADYLLKPVDLARFLKAANRAVEICRLQKKEKEYPETGEEGFGKQDDHFVIKSDNNYVKIRYTDILFIESLGNYSKLFVGPEKYHLALISLKKLEDHLPENFIRVHRSYLVPLDKITEIRQGELMVQTIPVPVGLSFKAALLEKVVHQKLISREEK